jgi:hypothetical protein
MLTILCIIFLIVVIYYLMYPSYSIKEHMTNDEAIANVASLYNTGNFTVSNMTTTNKLTSQKSFEVPSNGGFFSIKPGNPGDPGGRTFIKADDNMYLIANNTVISKYNGGTGKDGTGDLLVQNNATIDQDATVGRNLNVKGDTNISSTIASPGRMHISPTSDDLYLLPKQGTVRVSGAWGGNGNLVVDNDISANTLHVNKIVIGNKWVLRKGAGDFLLINSDENNEKTRPALAIAAGSDVPLFFNGEGNWQGLKPW